MRLLRRILAAVDLDQGSDRVVRFAGRLAQAFRAPVSLVHVIPGTDPGGQRLEDRRQDAATRLAGLRAAVAAEGVRVDEPIVDHGIPPACIAAHARQLDANLVVLGTGLRSRWGRPRLGGVAEEVVRHGPKPVLLVRSEGWSPTPRVLCPVAPFYACRRVLRNAVLLARVLKGRLEVLEPCGGPPGAAARRGAGLDPGGRGHPAPAGHGLGPLLEGIDLTGVEVQQTALPTWNPEQLLAQIHAAAPDLVVLGSVGSGGAGLPDGHGGIQHVLDGATCSVLLVRGDEPFAVCLEADEGDAGRMCQEGEELLRHGLPQEAVERFRRCLELHPTCVTAWGGMARAFERLGQHDQAEHAWQEAWQLRERLWELQTASAGALPGV